MNWTLWQNIVSPHLSPIARALASMPEQTVTVVAERGLPERTRAMGWQTGDCSPAQVIISPTDADVQRLTEQRPGQLLIHLLSGLTNVPLNLRVLPRLAKTGALIGLISESADNRGILGIARRAKYRFERHRVEPKLDFILAMGQLGVAWFESAGYEPSKIFPFGYMTEKPCCTSGGGYDDNERGRFRILYLGRILRLKDGVTAIRALGGLSDLNWQFDIIGDGPDRARWEKAAAESCAVDRIRFSPTIDNATIGNVLHDADLLLLPSRKDGWGAVVNEALMSGVPVVCSDNCGAADLLREAWRGSTFKAGSVRDLQRILQGWIERGKRTETSSTRIREWSSALEGPQVAQYLIAIVAYLRAGGHRPVPPWY
jgi:glycosyltransferase involved in cell wall biosynthesis